VRGEKFPRACLGEGGRGRGGHHHRWLCKRWVIRRARQENNFNYYYLYNPSAKNVNRHVLSSNGAASPCEECHAGEEGTRADREQGGARGVSVAGCAVGTSIRGRKVGWRKGQGVVPEGTAGRVQADAKGEQAEGEEDRKQVPRQRGKAEGERRDFIVAISKNSNDM